MDERGGLRLKWRLRCGLGGRLLEWHPWRSSRTEREKQGTCGMRDESESHFPPILSVTRGAQAE
jgi:hypothetical protein